jgi:SAM-dependent methyltransferase
MGGDSGGHGSGRMALEEYARIADAEQRHWWYRSMPALARAVLGPSLRPGLRILDAGCGPGPNFEWLRPYGEVVGVD